jgi:hypothetical protein
VGTFVDVENGIRRAVMLALQLDDAHVIWSDQDGIRPGQSVPSEGMFATIRLDSPLPVETPYLVHVFDGARDHQEFEQRVAVCKSIRSFVQVFGGTPSGGTVGDVSAVAVASLMQTRLRLPSIRAVIKAAGLSVFDYGTVRNVSRILQTAFESRAAVELGWYFTETASEFTTYIAEAIITATSQGVVFDVGPIDITEGPLPVNLGPTATIAILPAAGAGAAIDFTTRDSNGNLITQMYDGGGQVRFAFGTGFGAGPILRVIFSRTMAFFTATVEEADADAAAIDLKIQCRVDDSSGTKADIMFDASGISPTPGAPYTLKFTFAGNA